MSFSFPIGPAMGLSDTETKLAASGTLFAWLNKRHYLLRMDGTYHIISLWRHIKEIDPRYRDWFGMTFSEDELNELDRLADATDPKKVEVKA